MLYDAAAQYPRMPRALRRLLLRPAACLCRGTWYLLALLNLNLSVEILFQACRSMSTWTKW